MPTVVILSGSDTTGVYSDSLRQSGFEVVHADARHDVFQLAREVQPSLVVFSGDLLSLPGQWKAQPLTEHIPLLHIAGESQTEQCAEVCLSGADACLREPLQSDLLAVIAAALIRGSQGGQRSRAKAGLPPPDQTLRALIDCVPDEIWLFDTAGGFQFANRSALAPSLAPFEPAPPAGNPAKTVVYRADGATRPPDQAPPLRALRGERVRSELEILRTPALQEWRYRQVNASPICDPVGTITGAVALVRDITEHKRADAALRASEKQYRMLFEKMAEGFALVELIRDASGAPVDLRYMAVNPAFERHSGLTLDEIIGRTARELFPGIGAGWFRPYARVAQTGEPEHFEEWFGPLARWFRGSVFETEPGHFATIFSDTTDRKQAEDQFLSTLESIADGFLACDAGWRFIYMNATAERLLGVGRDEVLGRTHWEVFPALGTRLEAEFQQAAAGEPREFESYYERWDRWFQNRCFPRVGGGVSLYFRDITEAKRFEAALRQSEQQMRSLAGSLLTAQEDERRRLARELHDDITQRLAFLGIELGNLAKKLPGTAEETHTRLRELQMRTAEASIEVRRISHGLHPAAIEDLGLCAALEEFCGEWGSAHNVEVRFNGQIENAILDVAAATCLYRIAQESLRNAILHGEATQVLVSVSVGEGVIELRVRDNGIGYVNDSLRTKAGLGIVSMKERIRLVNGTLSFSSVEGEGVELTANIPLPKATS